MRRYASSLALLGLAISVSGCVYDPIYGPPPPGWCYHHPHKCPPLPPPPPPPPPPEYGPPPPMAAPMPPPPPPPQRQAETRRFTVFFDYNKSRLTAEAHRVIEKAVEAARQSGATRIRIIGHADTVGSDSYDQGLSEQRADVVKKEMLRGGLGNVQITTQGESYHRPRVPTGPNVREAENRRAVIEIEAGK